MTAEPPPQIEFVTDPLSTLSRPLALIGSQAYAAAWPLARHSTTSRWDAETSKRVPIDEPSVTVRQDLLIIRRDGVAFGPGGDHPISSLGFEPQLRLVPPPGRLWSPGAIQAYRAGQRPDPAAVFTRLCDVFDAFVDFDRSLAPQSTMAELCAVFVLTTWLSDAFSSLGYLWLSGDGGDNQSRLFELITRLGFLGSPVTPSADPVALRGLANYGALLAFDLTTTTARAALLDKYQRAQALSGHRRSTEPAAREYDPERQSWRLYPASAYCPRLFSASGTPDPQLAPACIVLPLVRPGSDRRAHLDPAAGSSWPHDPARLHDDLWSVALSNLSGLPDHAEASAFDPDAVTASVGPWRAILTTARWLQSSGVPGLSARLLTVAEAHETEAFGRPPDNLTIMIVRAIVARCAGLLWQKGGSVPEAVNISTDQVVTSVKLMLEYESPVLMSELTPQRVGRILAGLRLTQPPRPHSSNVRQWRLTGDELHNLAYAYGVPLPPPPEEPAPDPTA